MAQTAPSSFLFTANDRKQAWLTPSRIYPAPAMPKTAALMPEERMVPSIRTVFPPPPASQQSIQHDILEGLHLSGLGTEKGKILLRHRHHQKKRLQLHSRFMAKYPMRTVHT